jgi:hypothetical protein
VSKFIDGTVVSFALDGNGNVYDLERSGLLYENLVNGAWVPGVSKFIDGTVVSFALDGNGNVYDLEQSGLLYENLVSGSGGNPVGSAVVAFAIAPSGDVYASTTSGALVDLSTGAGIYQGSTFATMAFAADGSLIALDGNGDLMLLAQPGSGSCSQLAVGVASFEMDLAGTCASATLNDGSFVRLLV